MTNDEHNQEAADEIEARMNAYRAAIHHGVKYMANFLPPTVLALLHADECAYILAHELGPESAAMKFDELAEALRRDGMQSLQRPC